MNFNEINFNKKNRRPITETTYQIDAAEWNALGAKVKEIEASGGGVGVSEITIADCHWDDNEYNEQPSV